MKINRIKPIPDLVQGADTVVKISHNPTVDITGAVFEIILKRQEASTTESLRVTHTAGDSGSDDILNGVVYIPITGAEVSAMFEGEYWCSVTRTLNGQVLPVLLTGLHNVGTVTVHRKLKVPV